MRVLLIPILLLPVLGYADNLIPSDYSGTWSSNWVSVEGEKQELVISPDLSSSFERKFANNKEQKFKSKNAEIYDDILVIKYTTHEGKLRYKLVLSGWKLEKEKKLYGTMFFYENGEQFNGLPVSFVSNQKDR